MVDQPVRNIMIKDRMPEYVSTESPRPIQVKERIPDYASNVRLFIVFRNDISMTNCLSDRHKYGPSNYVCCESHFCHEIFQTFLNILWLVILIRNDSILFQMQYQSHSDSPLLRGSPFEETLVGTRVEQNRRPKYEDDPIYDPPPRFDKFCSPICVRTYAPAKESWTLLWFAIPPTLTTIFALFFSEFVKTSMKYAAQK